MNHANLTFASVHVPFVTVHASDLDGPRNRERLMCRGRPARSWLAPYAAHLAGSQVMLVVAMGRAALGATTRIRSIIKFAPSGSGSTFACVYVEESAGPAGRPRGASPVHVVGCRDLPDDVRFVEVKPTRAAAPRRSKAR